LTYEGRSAALVAVHDVTSVRRADRQREQTERFLNAIIENIPVSIIVKEPHDRRYVLINRAARGTVRDIARKGDRKDPR